VRGSRLEMPARCGWKGRTQVDEALAAVDQVLGYLVANLTEMGILDAVRSPFRPFKESCAAMHSCCGMHPIAMLLCPHRPT